MRRPLRQTNRLLSWVHTYRHAALFLIFFVILQLFNIVEQTVVPRYWVACSLDKNIPFIPVFVIPYVFWFLYVGAGLVYLCLRDKQTFIPTILLLCSGMAIAVLVYAVFPHGQPLRPAVTGSDPFSVFVRMSSTPTTPTPTAVRASTCSTNSPYTRASATAAASGTAGA